TQEHLASSDRMVMLTRRALLKAVREYEATGKLPAVLDDPTLCRKVRGGDVITRAGTDWLDAYEAAMTAAHGPGRSVAAESPTPAGATLLPALHRPLSHALDIEL